MSAINTTPVTTQIIEHLKTANAPVPTLVLAKLINGTGATAASINSTLYSMASQGLIVKIAEANGSKPRWMLSSAVSPSQVQALTNNPQITSTPSVLPASTRRSFVDVSPVSINTIQTLSIRDDAQPITQENLELVVDNLPKSSSGDLASIILEELNKIEGGLTAPELATRIPESKGITKVINSTLYKIEADGRVFRFVQPGSAKPVWFSEKNASLIPGNSQFQRAPSPKAQLTIIQPSQSSVSIIQ